jgi:hypothetical protein
MRRILLVLALSTGVAAAPDEPGYELAPVRYSTSKPADPLAKLQERMASGQAKLARDDAQGWLRSLLASLDIPVSSQSLVFSKTSFQRHKISPRSPRALYFNDDVYVGFVRGGEVLEVSAVDPQLGAVFYTVSQQAGETPKIARQTHNCLQCHDSMGLALGVPGHVVRSVFPDPDGMPHFTMGTFRTDDRSPYAERWGGWYVTGQHGAMRHLGNLTYEEDPNPDLKRLGDLGANVTDLSDRVHLRSYLAETSDIVALMVFEHQASVHNLITRANHQSRLALLQSDEINRLGGTPGAGLTDGTKSRIRASGEPLVEALLFSGEPPLASPVKGNSTFAADFEKRGPFDAKGRSLRQFDLQKRLFRHPLSYLIYSKAFAGLPAIAKEYVSGRLWEILSGRETKKEFAHLSADDRTAILGILRETLPEFTADWK